MCICIGSLCSRCLRIALKEKGKALYKLQRLEEKKRISTEEISAMQTQMCGFRERLSEMEVGIRRLMGTQQASDSVLRCPLSKKGK